jgi:hypothetical protein
MRGTVAAGKALSNCGRLASDGRAASDGRVPRDGRVARWGLIDRPVNIISVWLINLFR